MARVGYLDGSSWAYAEWIVAAVRAINPRHPPIRKYLRGFLMTLEFLAASKPRDVNMQYGRLAIVQRGEAALDRWCEIIWLGDALAMRAECLGDCREIPPFALTARGQPRLKLIGLGGNALGVHALHGRLHRLPAAIVNDDRQDWNPVPLRHRVDAVG